MVTSTPHKLGGHLMNTKQLTEIMQRVEPLGYRIGLYMVDGELKQKVKLVSLDTLNKLCSADSSLVVWVHKEKHGLNLMITPNDYDLGGENEELEQIINEVMSDDSLC